MLISSQRSRIVAAARAWIGTPVRHQARTLGHGVDCIGLIKQVGLDAGVLAEKHVLKSSWRGYSRQPDGKHLRAACEEYLVERPDDDMSPGSVLLMWVQTRRYPQHLGIVTNLPGRLGMVHSHAMHGAVCEHGLDDFWLKRIVAVYEFPGVI